MRPRELEDEVELVRAAQTGDREAFAELSERHYGAAYRWAYGLAMNRVDAEALTQQAFTKALVKVGGLRAGEAFRTWLRTIVHNCFIDQKRRDRRMGLVFVGDWVDEPVSAAPAPDHALDQARRAERARKLLATVEDEMTRFAIIRRFVDGWEYEDIARALGGAVKAGALRTRVCRALEKLRDTSK